MRKLIPQSECKDKIKLYKSLKNKKVISGRPEMTENKSPSENIFSVYTICLKVLTISQKAASS